MIDLLHIIGTTLTSPLTGVFFAVGIALAFMAYRSARVRSFLGRACAVAFGSLGLLFIAASNIGLPVVANNTMLELLPSTQYLSIARLGFAAPGDAPVLWYTATNSACSFNSGAGDGGSQIPSADGKCFIAQFTGLPDIREWGATPDGTPTGGTDNTTAFKAAALYSSQTGRAISVPAVGAFAIGSAPVQQYANSIFEGEGIGVLSSTSVVTGSLIIGLHGTSAPLFQSQNFSSLTGTNSNGGPYKFGFRNLAINGNKANRGGTSDCIDWYGYDEIIENLEISYCPGKGLYSEYGTSPAVPIPSPGNGDSMEAHVRNLKVWKNGGDGLDWYGPHDSVLTDVLSFLNGGYGLDAENSSNYVSNSSFLNFHGYTNGTSGTAGVKCNAQMLVSNFQSESNPGDGIDTASNWDLEGTYVLTYSNTGNGITVDGGTLHVSNLQSSGNGGAGLYASSRNYIAGSNFSLDTNGKHGFETNIATEIAGFRSVGNSGDGIRTDTSEINITSIYARGNGGWGVNINGTSLGDILLSGESSSNTTGQLNFGTTLQLSTRISMTGFNTTTAYSRTYASNAFIDFQVTGNGATPLFVHP